MRPLAGRTQEFFQNPYATGYLLIAANIIAYGACLYTADIPGAAAPPNEVLFRMGAMYSSALARHEYWRLFAAGFLHANLIHLTFNMLCLALWGGHLEQRVGALYFIIVYVAALVGGGLVGSFTHSGPYLSVGASGATSGIMGALLCLAILGKIGLRADFFVVNIGLNIALAFAAPSIDWRAHVGGFIAGMVTCVLLDLFEKAIGPLLRCKFPEFVKTNCFALFAGIALVAWDNRPFLPSAPTESLLIATYLVVCLAIIKSADIVLSLKKGLALVVLALAAANAGLLLLAQGSLAPMLAARCATRRFETAPVERAVGLACNDLTLTFQVAAACLFMLTVLLYSNELRRGLKDVGFVGGALRAERQRRHGI